MPSAVAEIPEDLVVDFDLFDPSLCIPEDTLQQHTAELAAKAPVLYTTAHGGHWLVTRYAEVREVLNDPETSSRASRTWSPAAPPRSSCRWRPTRPSTPHTATCCDPCSTRRG